MREGAVKYLRQLGWDVCVVLPNHESAELIKENGHLLIPFKKKHIQKYASLMERLGVYEDYLDRWIPYAIEVLQPRIGEKDILFASSGGELGMIKLGSELKKIINCKFVANFRDPLNYGFMDGMKRDNKPHVGRVKAHGKYIQNADKIITSSMFYSEILLKRFSNLSEKISCNYLGYVKDIDLSNYTKKESPKLRIAYAGLMSPTQKPELLLRAFEKLNRDDVEIYFIGNVSNYAPLKSIERPGVIFINHMPHDQFLQFMAENIDIGFVSLVRDYYGACVPSKIYEYINLGLPMLGALPEGDGMDIINQHQLGLSVHYDDVDALCTSIGELNEKRHLKEISHNVIKIKPSFSMENRILEVHDSLRQLMAL